jgi:hypothetical protein
VAAAAQGKRRCSYVTVFSQDVSVRLVSEQISMHAMRLFEIQLVLPPFTFAHVPPT